MAENQYFVERYPEKDQLIYVFTGKDEECSSDGTWPVLARYAGNGVVVTANLHLWPIGAGSAWTAAETQKIEPAKIRW